MIKRLFSFLLILCPVFVFSQDTKVVTGVVNFESQDYKKAIDNFETALANTKDLKPSNVPKAYYYYGISLLMEFGKDADSEKYSKAFDAFKNVLKTDDGTWKAKCEKELQLFSSYALSFGIETYNRSFNTGLFERPALYDLSEKFFNAAKSIEPEHYLSYDMLGQVFLSKNDTISAKNNLETALALFEKRLPGQPDINIAYTAYRLAIIERYKNKNYEKALTIIDKGKNLGQKEYDRAQNKTAELKTALDKALSTLSDLELDIYVNVPEKKSMALEKLEKAIQADPGNYNKHIVYASLLETSDENKSVEVYEKAIKIKPSEITAYYNLGAMYNNIAARYSKQAKAETDQGRIKELNTQITNYLEKGYMQFQKAHEINPKEMSVLNALISISSTLGKDEDFVMYKEKKKALSN